MSEGVALLYLLADGEPEHNLRYATYATYAECGGNNKFFAAGHMLFA